MKTTGSGKQESKVLPVTSAQRWAVAIHESGHSVAASEMGLGLRPRGIEVSGQEGMTYARGTGFRSRRPDVRQRAYRAGIVVDFAGPIAHWRVSEDLVHIDDDVQNIAFSLRELLGCKKLFVEKACRYEDEGEFWAMIYTLATCGEENEALAELDVFPGREKIDMSILRMLWPLAQRARSIVQAHRSTIEEIADELVRKERMNGGEIEEIISRHSVIAMV
jgi:hypothetical protein